MTKRICSVDGCENVHNCNGLCLMHYSRFRRHGDPMVTKLRQGVRGVALADFERLLLIETDEHVLWPHLCFNTGYGQVWIDGRKRVTHQIALEQRTGQTGNKNWLARHGHGCPRNCMNYRHLTWGTQQQNSQDRLRDGTDSRGENHYRTTLTADDVRSIRARLAAGGVLHRELAAEYGVGTGAIMSIARRNSWAWLED